MTAEQPLFSVLMPASNQAAYLGEALDSLLAQTERDWEAVVLDDGSTDATRAILARYGERDPRIRALHPEHGGLARALNAGLEQARGRWICFLPPDDLYDPAKLAVDRAAIAGTPTSMFFYTGFRILRARSGTVYDPPLHEPTSSVCQVVDLLFQRYIAPITMCVQREVFGDRYRFDERAPYAPDYELLLRLLSLYRATPVPARTAIIRQYRQQPKRHATVAAPFDVARAAIAFLNDHPFVDLFPTVDWTDRAQALQATARSLVIAADPMSVLYGLGPTSALLGRILEFLSSRSSPFSAAAARQLVRFYANQVDRLYGGSDFMRVWQAAASYPDSQESILPYRAVDPLAVAEASCLSLERTRDQDASALRRYMTEVLGRDPPPAEGA